MEVISSVLNWFSSNILHFVEKLKDPQSVGDYRGVRGTFGKAI